MGGGGGVGGAGLIEIKATQPASWRWSMAELGKSNKMVGFHPARNAKKNHAMVPPLHHIQAKNKNHSSLARMISALRRSFFANLVTFERRSGLKNFFLLKISILKMG